jgi:hypothetical protein
LISSVSVFSAISKAPILNELGQIASGGQIWREYHVTPEATVNSTGRDLLAGDAAERRRSRMRLVQRAGSNPADLLALLAV